MRRLTALQPSGILHIGNYFGAIKPFVDSQDGNENFLFAVDYHAITVPQDPAQLREQLLFSTAVYLAAGVNPDATVLFQQSQVSEHTELAWILNCVTHMGELERMTQFKDKARNKGESVTIGLFDYPVLMAADILLYDTDEVPVGADQKQHVELARNIAERFNHRFGDTFTVPTPVIPTVGARIMSLDNPENKMSKSAPSPKSYISLLDTPEVMKKKIMSAVTDSGTDITYDDARPALANLLTLFHLASGKSIETIVNEFQGSGYGDFKRALADVLIEYFTPLQTRIQTFMKDPTHLIDVLNRGSDTARDIASKKMTEVRKKIGVSLH